MKAIIYFIVLGHVPLPLGHTLPHDTKPMTMRECLVRAERLNHAHGVPGTAYGCRADNATTTR